MQGWREFRTVTGKKVWTKETREQARDRRLFWLEVVATPLLMIFLFAKCAGMI